MGRSVSRRAFLNMAGAAVGGAVLGACVQPAAAPTAAPSAVPATPAATAKGSFVYWDWGMPASLETLEGVEQELGIKIEVTMYPWEEYMTVLKVAFPSGTVPDCLGANSSVVSPYASAEFLSPLEDFASDMWGSEWKSQFVQISLDEMFLIGAKEGQGHLYAMPTYPALQGTVWYHMPIFEKLGLTEPKTWAEFEAVCDAVKESGVIPVAEGNKDQWRVLDWFQSLVEVAAPDKMDQIQDHKGGKLTDDDMVQTFHLYKRMCDRGWFGDGGALGTDFGGAMPLFFDGKAAMLVMGTYMWFMANPAKSPETAPKTHDLGSFPIPQSKNLVSACTAYSIPKAAKNPNLAWEFIAFFAAGKGQQMIADNPDLPGCLAFKPKPLGTPFDENVIADEMRALANGPNKLRNIRCAALYDATGPVAQGVLTGQLTPEAAMAELQRVFDESCAE